MNMAPSSRAVVLLLPEAFCLLDGEHEFLLQLLVTLVRGEVQSIKALLDKWEDKQEYIEFSRLKHKSYYTSIKMIKYSFKYSRVENALRSDHSAFFAACDYIL